MNNFRRITFAALAAIAFTSIGTFASAADAEPQDAFMWFYSFRTAQAEETSADPLPAEEVTFNYTKTKR